MVNYSILLEFLKSVEDKTKLTYITLSIELLKLINKDIKSDVIKLTKCIESGKLDSGVITAIEALRLKR